jgi:hypothetical protein
MLTGEVKQRLIAVLSEIVARHQRARAQVTEEVHDSLDLLSCILVSFLSKDVGELRMSFFDTKCMTLHDWFLAPWFQARLTICLSCVVRAHMHGIACVVFAHSFVVVTSQTEWNYNRPHVSLYEFPAMLWRFCFVQMVDAFMAVRPLPNMFGWASRRQLEQTFLLSGRILRVFRIVVPP